MITLACVLSRPSLWLHRHDSGDGFEDQRAVSSRVPGKDLTAIHAIIWRDARTSLTAMSIIASPFAVVASLPAREFFFLHSRL